ncbi:LytR/AlgR family response regulator transcription factor [Parapedobacter sp. 2B3]|uniref:LytR/AlgR family response regulator transcription factor n=1 Tax=Parapedobacter sp. 2B3 TaxID=3342381 RepID=UPI0035B5B1BD
MAYRCIIIDDDEIDRLTVCAFARKYAFLDIVGMYDSPAAALAEIEETRPQVLLLDIDMGAISGLQFRKELIDAEACIFITSYPDYAVESFELAALDFLVKPLETERFAASMQRLEEYLQMHRKSGLLDHSLHGDTLFIKDGHQQVKVRSSDILYLEALKDYTLVVTKIKRYHVLASLGNLLKTASFAGFLRVHRSYAVQPHFIEKMSSSELLIDGISIPIGRSYKEAVRNLTR